MTLQEINSKIDQLQAVKNIITYDMPRDVFSSASDTLSKLMESIVDDCMYFDYSEALKLRKRAEDIFYSETKDKFQ